MIDGDLKDLEIIQISQNQDGNWYVIYRVPKVARGMHGKSKGHVDELLIIGMNKKVFPAWCKKHGIIVKKENLEDGSIEVFGD